MSESVGQKVSPQKCLMSQFLKLVNIILNGIKKKKERETEGGREEQRNGGRKGGRKRNMKLPSASVLLYINTSD